MYPGVFQPPYRPVQTLYKRLCECKPQYEAAEPPSESGDTSQDLRTQIAGAFSELNTLCRTWEKNASLASLALEGGLCCLSYLKRCTSPNENTGKGESNGVVKGGNTHAALDGALEGLAATVGVFFKKRRGGGITARQVRDSFRFVSFCEIDEGG